MIVATRLSAVWQVAGVAAAALCCYLVSQSVAAERAGLLKVDRQIEQTHDEIAKLQTEIGVRGRMGQLERWNMDVLALQAPRPSQFVANGVQLASLYGRKGQPALPLDPAIVAQQGAIDKVAFTPSSPPSVQPAPTPPGAVTRLPEMTVAQPLLRTATYVRPAPDRLAPAASTPLIAKVSFEPSRPSPKTAPTPDKPAKRAAKSLLPADIGLLAAREATGSKDSLKAAR
ncbi:hypothetical protein [Sphingomonas crusticola]|uniref:hypothetical protein n=1 Tax=Sphingomonas crusticola TaxID=1697973 RepID=UPI000E259962|nr:hypothetical protein [Sphingomonas crusticola]